MPAAPQSLSEQNDREHMATVCSLAPVRKVPKRMTRPDHGETGEGSSVSLCLFRTFNEKSKKAESKKVSAHTHFGQMLEQCFNIALTFH